MEETSMHQDQSPIEQVRLTVPTTDNPTLPTLTLRVWIIGTIGCIIISIVSVLTSFRQNPVGFPDFVVTILCYSIGKFMAYVLPSNLRIRGTRINISLNPGIFNMKEHILSTMIFSSGLGTIPATNIYAATRAYFRISIHPMAFFFLLLTTNNIINGFVGFFMKYFVTPSEMWWPEVLPNVTMFRAFHEKDENSNAKLSRSQFFFMIFVISFSYYIVPGYFFPSISAMSVVCLIWKRSITAQQLGSGLNGFGIGSFGLDWSTYVSFTGNPIYYPFFVIVNTMVGFIIFMYIVVPFAYWTNSFKAKSFPIISSEVYDVYGGRYNLSKVVDGSNFQFKKDGYESYSELYLSITRACSIGFGFAALAASLTNIVLSHGRSFLNQLRQSTERKGSSDVHMQMMNKYRSIPMWWFVLLTISMIGLTVFTCEGFGSELQLPYWGIILACALVFMLVPPLAALRGTVCQQPPLSLVAHIIIGYLYPGRPLANMVFGLYTTWCIEYTLGNLANFKFGIYMKIPPRDMFFAQVIGSLLSTISDFAVTWWLFSTVEDLCRPELLPRGSPWTCPSTRMIYNEMVIWGLIGPKRMFFTGVYSKLGYFFLIGLVAPIPVWILARRFPEKKWIKLILVPVLFAPGTHIPPASSVNYLCWFVLGFIFNYVIFRRCKQWWARYSLLFSLAMDTGIAALALLTTVALQMRGINGVDWWGSDVSDHCPLATCPTEPGVHVKGCPIAH